MLRNVFGYTFAIICFCSALQAEDANFHHPCLDEISSATRLNTPELVRCVKSSISLAVQQADLANDALETELEGLISENSNEIRSLSASLSTQEDQIAGVRSLIDELSNADLDRERSASLICGAKNGVSNFGSVHSMYNSNTCDAICSATTEDRKKCISPIVFDAAGRIQGGSCEWKIGSVYFGNGRDVFCCCY